MNKTIILLTLLVLSQSANAGLLSSALTSGWDDKEPTTKYQLETKGYDLRVYEWVPQDNPDWRCVFVAGEENSTGVACYPASKLRD